MEKANAYLKLCNSEVKGTYFWPCDSFGTRMKSIKCTILYQLVIMYGITGLAFLFYLGKIPERFLPGRFDTLGKEKH